MRASYRARFPNDLTSRVTREGHDPVASGGFADIYRGIFQQNGESIRVAIKSIKTYSGEDRSLSKKQKRLRREIKVWLGLRHDNVLPLLGTTMGFGQFPAMVCPWVENGSLTSYLTDHHHTLPVAKILGLLNNVACGLCHLHSCSVVHGDLSGSNVLIREDGKACIADFGLSMLLTELGGSTFATSFHAKGTLRWTAPELLDLDVPEDDLDEESQHVGPTTQSDVYSFGSIMLQILSGKVPYHYYKREGQVVHAISKGKKPKRPSDTLITDARWMFIELCWSAVDARRPSSDKVVEFTEKELVDNRPRPATLKDIVNPWPRTPAAVESTTAHGHFPQDERMARLPDPPEARHYRQRETVKPTFFEKIDDALSPLPPFVPPLIPIHWDSVSSHVRPVSPPRYLRQRFRPRHDSSDSIPNITVELPSSPELSSPERQRSPLQNGHKPFNLSLPDVIVGSPSEPETTRPNSPAVPSLGLYTPTARPPEPGTSTMLACPELLSPEAAHLPLPLPADIPSLDIVYNPAPPARPSGPETIRPNPPQLLSPEAANPPLPRLVTAPRVYKSALRAGSLRRPPDQDSTSNTKYGDHRRAHSVPFNGNPDPDSGRSRNGNVQTRKQNTSVSEDPIVSSRFPYTIPPMPVGASYPPPPVRRPYKNQDQGSEGSNRVRREGDAAEHILDALVEFMVPRSRYGPGTFARAEPAPW